MKINSVNSNCKFGMQLTREVEEGFRKSKENVMDFYGENSPTYKEFCDNLRRVKDYSKNYVIGIGREEGNVCYPYYFMMRHKLDDKIYYRAGCLETETKEELFSPNSLNSLALTAYLNEQKERNKLEEALKPKKESFFKRLFGKRI